MRFFCVTSLSYEGSEAGHFERERHNNPAKAGGECLPFLSGVIG
jgi:hypothetical protein